MTDVLTDDSACVARAVELFDEGQAIVELAISEASEGDLPDWDEIKRLDLTTRRLRNRAKVFEKYHEDFDATTWDPYHVSDSYPISSANELQHLCELQSQHKILNGNEIQVFAEATRRWMSDIVDQLSAEQETEAGLTRGSLSLFRFLNGCNSWVAYDTLNDELWDDPISYRGIQTALKRLQTALNADFHFELTIEHSHKRARLRKTRVK